MSSGFTVQELINLPIHQVWRFLADIHQAPRWMKGVNHVTFVAPGTGDVIGSRFQLRLAVAGGGREREIEIVAWEPNHRLTLSSVEGGVSASYEYTLRARGNRTEIVLRAECSATGLWKLLHPLLRYKMRRLDGDQLKIFKDVIESAVDPPHESFRLGE